MRLDCLDEGNWPSKRRIDAHDVDRSRASRASESTSGVERDPGDVHASRTPQRTSSSTNARSPR